VLLLGHHVSASGALLTGTVRSFAGVAAGLAIDVVAALLGVAGGELLISDARVAVWRGHQTCRQPVTGGELADDAGRIRSDDRRDDRARRVGG
jgi:hypothetical protein